MDMMKSIQKKLRRYKLDPKYKVIQDVQIVYQPEAKCFHLQDDNKSLWTRLEVSF